MLVEKGSNSYHKLGTFKQENGSDIHFSSAGYHEMPIRLLQPEELQIPGDPPVCLIAFVANPFLRKIEKESLVVASQTQSCDYACQNFSKRCSKVTNTCSHNTIINETVESGALGPIEYLRSFGEVFSLRKMRVEWWSGPPRLCDVNYDKE